MNSMFYASDPLDEFTTVPTIGGMIDRLCCTDDGFDKLRLTGSCVANMEAHLRECDVYHSGMDLIEGGLENYANNEPELWFDRLGSILSNKVIGHIIFDGINLLDPLLRGFFGELCEHNWIHSVTFKSTTITREAEAAMSMAELTSLCHLGFQSCEVTNEIGQVLNPSLFTRELSSIDFWKCEFKGLDEEDGIKSLAHSFGRILNGGWLPGGIMPVPPREYDSDGEEIRIVMVHVSLRECPLTLEQKRKLRTEYSILRGSDLDRFAVE